VTLAAVKNCFSRLSIARVSTMPRRISRRSSRSATRHRLPVEEAVARLAKLARA
jgi:hypothetical protein